MQIPRVWFVEIKSVEVKPAGDPTTPYIAASDETVMLAGSKCEFRAVRNPPIDGNEPEPYWPTEYPKWTMPKDDTFTLDDKASTDGKKGIIAKNSGEGVANIVCGNSKTVRLASVKPELVSVDFKKGAGNGAWGIQDIWYVNPQTKQGSFLILPEWMKTHPTNLNGWNEPFCIVSGKKYQITAELSAKKI